MKIFLQSFVRHLAFSRGWWPSLYRRLCRPDGFEYADFLRLHGGYHAIGAGCSILMTTTVTDPAYVSLGNNVQFSDCSLIGHDGAVAMLHRAFNVSVDSVGKIEIRDNVFIGYHAVILPNVTIGPNSIVAAGAVVTKDVEPGDIVAGVPARPIGKVTDLVAKLQKETSLLPWGNLIRDRALFDGSLEPELVRQRVRFFYGA